MLSTAFILKRLEFTESQETVLWVAWNKTENYIAAGGQAGSVRLLLLDFNASSDSDYRTSDFRASTRKLKILIDKKLNLHENALITSVAWNERETKLATSDKQGLIFISSTDTGKWVRNLVNDSSKASVVTAVWSPDASRILMVYVNGLIMLGTASGHRIFNGTINKGSPPKFGLISSTFLEIFIIGWGNIICCYNFSGEELWSVSPLLATSDEDKFVHGCWSCPSEAMQLTALSPSRDSLSGPGVGHSIKAGPMAMSEPKLSEKLVTVTSNGLLCVYSALTGEMLSSISMEISPTYVQASPGGHMFAITGSVASSESSFGRRQLQDSLIATGPASSDGKNTAILVVYRAADLIAISRLRLPEQVATSTSWDSTGLRLVLAAGKNIYLASVRPSYNHYLMSDGTMVFSVDGYVSTVNYNASFANDPPKAPDIGSLFSKKVTETETAGATISSFEERVINRARNNECVLFWKPGLQMPYQRWPSRMISLIGCQNYVAILTLKQKSSSTRRYCTQVCFYTSVCAPIFSVDLTYVPFYTAGTGNYLVCASTSRISVIDIRSLANEAIGIKGSEKITHVYEWHADSSPLAQDRELTVTKLTVNNPVIGVACCDTVLFVARADERVQRYSLPSLALLETMTIRPNLDYIQTNCNGTILGCVHEDGSLVFYYTSDFYSEALYMAYGQPDRQSPPASASLAPGGSKVARPQAQAQAQLALLDNGVDAAAALGFEAEPVQEMEEASYVIKDNTARTINVRSEGMDAASAPAAGPAISIPPYSPDLLGIWGLVFSPEDPNLVAVSSQYKVIVLHLDEQKREDAIQTSAHVLGFSGLSLVASYLDEVAHHISSLEHAYSVLETQTLRELQDVMFGTMQARSSFGSLVDSVLGRGCLNRNLISLTADTNSTISNAFLDQAAPKTIAIKPARANPQDGLLGSSVDIDASNSSQMSAHGNKVTADEDGRDTINLAAAIEYVRSHPSVHLYRIVAEASLINLNLEVASYFYIRAGDYVSYHFCESLLRLSSENQKRAEIFMFLGNFAMAENMYKQALGRPDLIVKTQTDLQMWLSIIRSAKLSRAPGGNLLIDDSLMEQAYKAIGQYYMRQQQYSIACDFLQKSGDPYLYAESLFASKQYTELKNLATSLSVDEFSSCIGKIAVMLARLGDVEGASEALVRMNNSYGAVQICLHLKRFDIAAAIAGKYNILPYIDRELSVYLKQLLTAGDDQGALELLRRTNQGEIIAAIILNLALKELQNVFDNRLFPMPPGLFNRLRRIIVLAGKEATYVHREQVKRDLQAHSASASDRMLTEQATNATIDTFITGEDEDQGVSKKGQSKDRDMNAFESEFEGVQSRLRSVPVIWRIARQARFIVLSSYMLYINNPEQAIWPAVEASNYYRYVNGSQVSLDPYIQYLSRIAMAIAAQAALLFGDFELASNLLEVIEADTDLPASERDQLEQMSVMLFSEYSVSSVPSKRKDNYRVNCGHCNALLPPYCGMCEKCNWQVPICVRTGQPIKPDKMDRTVMCSMCRSLSTVGKTTLVVCPLCHEPYQ